MKRYFKFVLLLGICLIFLTGCIVDLVIPENDSSSPSEEDGVVAGKGTLKIYLTDAPGDYSEVNITISKIEGHIAGDGEEGEDKGSWKPLKEWSGGLPVNLIELEDVSILLASLELEPNKYTQLRLFLNEEATLIIEGEEGPVPLEIPSSANTGIKLNHPFEIMEGKITKLTIDFDAEKSVIKTGNGKYKMKPVISVTSSTYSTINVPGGVGSVSGSVSYYQSGELALVGIGGANIELTGGAYIFANTTTTSTGDPVGTFSLINVPAGNYVLNVDAGEYGDYSENIEVIKNVVTPVNVVFLLEEPGIILGSVVDSVDEEPIEGATVSAALSGSAYIFSNSAVTNEDGSFLIEQLPVGTYDLTASATNYDNNTVSGIVVTAGGIIDVDIIELELLPPPLP